MHANDSSKEVATATIEKMGALWEKVRGQSPVAARGVRCRHCRSLQTLAGHVVLVARQHSEWLKNQIVTADLALFPHFGHSLSPLMPHVLAWLLACPGPLKATDLNSADSRGLSELA
ncbi:hypothetical protein PYH37_006255 (plasmid) [Sinorhizobium numidicum]|uniref:Uncharacterized protein n=1 Tax=Sinorhizobium numidicum TaxID=680248 RepID=A0ABY8D772_9HYPH|nr:hypothetical protein [Sinorhizobium numidicum]WEX79731.1 hypothetical protein PYH37_006255 [Sinorhizobium numidicum]WEX85703.1 hypothetical protein PYH38_006129 [Sinorhizobium numidicum]